MSPMSTSRRFLAVGLTAVSLVSPIAVHQASATDEGDSSVVVESTGDQSNAITLPPTAALGQAASSITTVELAITADAAPIELAIQVDLSSAIDEVSDDGGYVAVTTIDQVQLVNAPEGVDGSALGYDALAGARFQQTFDPTGRIVATEVLDAESLSDAARLAAEGFTGNLQSAQFVYPAEVVGVGAKWSAELEIAAEGFTIPATYHYELTDVSDGRYTIAVSYDTAFDTTIQEIPATGTVTGLGTVTGSIDNPLDLSVTLGQTIDASSGGVDLNVVVGIDVQSTGG